MDKTRTHCFTSLSHAATLGAISDCIKARSSVLKCMTHAAQDGNGSERWFYCSTKGVTAFFANPYYYYDLYFNNVKILRVACAHSHIAVIDEKWSIGESKKRKAVTCPPPAAFFATSARQRHPLIIHFGGAESGVIHTHGALESTHVTCTHSRMHGAAWLS